MSKVQILPERGHAFVIHGGDDGDPVGGQDLGGIIEETISAAVLPVVNHDETDIDVLGQVDPPPVTGALGVGVRNGCSVPIPVSVAVVGAEGITAVIGDDHSRGEGARLSRRLVQGKIGSGALSAVGGAEAARFAVGIAGAVPAPLGDDDPRIEGGCGDASEVGPAGVVGINVEVVHVELVGPLALGAANAVPPLVPNRKLVRRRGAQFGGIRDGRSDRVAVAVARQDDVAGVGVLEVPCRRGL